MTTKKILTSIAALLLIFLTAITAAAAPATRPSASDPLAVPESKPAEQTERLAGQEIISAVGSWNEARTPNGSLPVCMEYSGDFTQIRYGVGASSNTGLPTEAEICATSPFLEKSGLEFDGYQDVSIVCDDVFKIGEFSHHNNPIYYINSYDEDILRTSRLDISVSGDAQVTLPVFINFEETPNSPPCDYGGDSNGCFDRVTYSVSPQTLVLNGQTCELTIDGFGDCSNPTDEFTSGEFITLEGGVANRTCLWASTSEIVTSNPATPPPTSCPVGYNQIDTIQGTAVSSTVNVYNYSVTEHSEILLQGWAKEGAPDLGCSISGDGDLNPICNSYQNSENFDVYINSALGRYKFGEYRDNLGAGSLQNYYFHNGPYQINVESGPFTIEVEHPGPITWHNVGYQLAVCSKVVGINTTRDFGDAPSPFSSASAIATVGLTIGTEVVDSENGMIRDADALGDDLYGSDDENGVFFLDGGPVGTPPEFKSVEVTVVNTAVPNAYLYGWLDFDGDGIFESSEQIINGDVFPQATGGSPGVSVRVYGYNIPADALCGTTFARFRLDSTPFNLGSGDGNQGEIEDYVFQLCDTQKDYGDAPVSYGTASHTWVPGLRLGYLIDKEPGSLFSATAEGDDLSNRDDEDGVEFLDGTIFEQGVKGYRVRVTVYNEWDKDQKVYAWIDFNQDGVFDKNDEKIFDEKVDDEDVDYEVFIKEFDIPDDAPCGVTYARFRLGKTDEPTGHHDSGEVEDYKVEINCTDPTQEPSIYCPAGFGQISEFSGSITDEGTRNTYNFDMPFDGPFFTVGYVMEGHPDLGCSLKGKEDSDAKICEEYEDKESINIIHKTTLDETVLGTYLDNKGDNDWENFYLEVGPFLATFAPVGPNQMVIESIGEDTLGYKFAICAGDPDITPSTGQDLAVTVDGPAKTGPSESFNWTFTAQNLSTAESGRNVRMVSTFPPEVTISSVLIGNPSDWSCTTTLGQLACDALIDLIPGYSTTFLAVANVPVDYSSTEIRNQTIILSNPSDPVANQFNNIDIAVTSVVQADLSIDIQADKDPILLEETMTWTALVSNDNANPLYMNTATNPSVTVDLPAGVIYTNHSAFNGWSCSFAGSQATCTHSSLPYGTSNQKVIEVLARIPGIYVQDTVTADAEIDSDTYDPVPANNTDAVTSAVDRTWTVPDGLENLIIPYSHVRFADSLNVSGNDLDQEWNYGPEEYIENLLQIPIDGAFAISNSGAPTLTVKYCTTPGNTGQCSSPDAIIEGEMIIESVLYDTLIYQANLPGGSLIDSGPNFLTTPITVAVGIDPNPLFRTGRYLVTDVADCQAIGDPSMLENAVDCLMPYDDMRAMVAETQPLLYERIFEWQPYEMVAIISETKGGRSGVAPAGRAGVVYITNAKPGLYRLSGHINITVEFIDSRLGPNPVVFDLPDYPISAYFQLIAPFTEPES